MSQVNRRHLVPITAFADNCFCVLIIIILLLLIYTFLPYHELIISELVLLVDDVKWFGSSELYSFTYFFVVMSCYMMKASSLLLCEQDAILQ